MLSSRDALITFSYRYKGDWNKIYNAIKTNEEVKEEDAIKCDNAITILDDDYPDYLKSIFHPPFVLFYHGDKSLLNATTNKVAILGSRNCSDNGKHIAEKIADRNTKCLFVSGNAMGIQASACRKSMANKDKIILVIGNGINAPCYPSSNIDIYAYAKTDGLIISEYPDKTDPAPTYFSERNRILMAICDTPIIVEVEQHSGIIIAVNYALNMGKDIYVVPQPYDSDLLNNKLIGQGANIYSK